MNSLLIIILIILAVDFFFNRWLDNLNIKSWKPQLPIEAEGIYDEERYRKSRDYHLAHHRLSQASSWFSFLLSAVVLSFGLFGKADSLLRNYSEQPIILALLFFGALGFLSDILSLPFSLYGIFVIEEKFGFNKMTWKTFLFDKLKSYLLAVIIGGSLLAALVFIQQSTGSHFWLYALAVVSIFMIFSLMFYTSLILPLFNKLTPLTDGELKEAIKNYCNKTVFNLSNLFVIDGSKRSSKANAFFSGLGRKKKIILYDTLVNNRTNDELVAVLAHEVGHYKKKHIRTNLILGLIQTTVMLFLLSLFLDSTALSMALGAAQPSFHINILAFGLLYSPLSEVLGLFMNYISRKHEFEADRFCAETFNGEPLMSALKKLSSDNLSNLTPHPLYVLFHYSHPTLLQRLKALDIFIKR
ncbi:MAG: M48 family metallopeptidase [Bacteroidia bacterium]|nr:M48 family metallopeptidase [Bacteroidia bacterium]